MRPRSVAAALTILLTSILIFPSAFFIAPQKAQAVVSVEEVGPSLSQQIITAIKTTLSLSEETKTAISAAYTATKAAISAAADVANEASLQLLVVDRYVIQPLAYILSGNVLKAMTGSAISFVIGKTNGTGAPQFAQNVNGLMRSVGDVQSAAFLKNYSQLNSPFGSSIASALKTNYLQQTSAAGWFAANKSTFVKASPNVNAFLAGNWSQGGGVRAWFALTTQNQNNPYTLYQNSQSQMSILARTAQSATKAQLDWGKGFLSWCGTLDTTAPTAGGDYDTDDGNDPGVVGDDYDDDDGNAVSPGVSGPGPNCWKKDGSPGIIKTPGSYIADTLSKAVGANQDKLVAAGNAGSELNGILGNIGSILKSVNTMATLLGGAANSFGLAGAAQSSGGNQSVLGGLNTPGFAGVTSSSVVQGGAAITGGDLSSRIAQYETSLGDVTFAANQAKTDVATLASSCPNQSGSTTSLTTQIDAALAAVAQGQSIVESAKIVLAQTNANPDPSGNVASLANVPPTTADIANMEQFVSQMGAVSAQVQGIKASCNVQAP